MPHDDQGVARWWRVGLLLAVLAPFGIGLVAVARDEWHPHSDRAVIAARTADVFGGDLPLTGAYSRYAFSHPGPLENLLLAVPYELSGERPRALLAGTLLVGAASAAAAVLLALRRGGLPGGLAVTTALLLVMRSLGPEVLRDPWNPYFPLMPVALVVVAAWSTSCGSRWSLPVLVGAASVVVQAHVGTTVVVGALALWAVVSVVLLRRRDRGWLAPALTAAAVGLVLWLPPVIDQLTAEQGNLGAIWSFFTGSDGARQTSSQVAGVAGRELGPVGPWLTGTEPEFFGVVQPGWSGWPVVLVLGLVGVLVARRYLMGGEDDAERAPGPDPVARFVATAAIGIVATVLALAGVRDEAYGYLFRWSWVTAAFGWAALGWGIAALAWARFGSSLRRPVPAAVPTAAVAVLAVAGLAIALPGWGSDDPDQVASDAIARLVPAAEASLEPGQVVTFASIGDDIGRLGGGVVFELERRGHPLAVGEGDARIWGNRRAERDESAPEAARLLVATGPGAAALDEPGVMLLATYDQLGPEERAELEAMRADIAERVAASGQDPAALLPDLRAAGLNDAELARLADLSDRSFEAAVYRDSPLEG